MKEFLIKCLVITICCSILLYNFCPRYERLDRNDYRILDKRTGEVLRIGK
jgi:hypothetical protein